MLPDDSFIVKLLCVYRFYPDSIAVPIFFLLQAKCPVIAQSLEVPVKSIVLKQEDLSLMK